MYEAIVVGTDGSPTAAEAVEHAAVLARCTGATLHIVSAYKTMTTEAALVGSSAEAAFLGIPAIAEVGVLDALDTAEQILEDSSARPRREGVDVTGHARPGTPAKVLLDVVEEEKADLLVVGSRGLRGVRRLLGSVPSSVAHQAPCHVLIVRTC